jgi:hypothetical protein
MNVFFIAVLLVACISAFLIWSAIITVAILNWPVVLALIAVIYCLRRPQFLFCLLLVFGLAVIILQLEG